MKPFLFCSAVLLLLLLLFTRCEGGNILVLPFEGSHWINMAVMIKALHSRDHNITVIRVSDSRYINENPSFYNTISVQVKVSDTKPKKKITTMLQSYLDKQRRAPPLMTLLRNSVEGFQMLVNLHQKMCALVSAMIDDEKLMIDLKASKFDLLLSDPSWGGGAVVAKYLDLPLVHNVRWLIKGEAHLALAPSPLSYVPITETGFTDKMTFLQRVKNIISYTVTQTVSFFIVTQTYQPLCEKYLGPNSNFYDLLLEADIWLMRVDFVFEFPRPTMPNVVYIGGFQCKPANPLPPHLEDFMQSSGQHGVILMSMGTFVEQLPNDVTEEIAAAFAKLPQKVIWKHKGHRPTNLGNNTLLVDWMPQNDILGHPKTRLFVGHGGTNSVQEAIFHGVPVIGVPLFFDQLDNLVRLKERGASKILSLSTIDKNSFLNTVQEVLYEPSYRENMQRLSRLHHDQPMKPLDSAIFWIEYVMRHKGAAHLRTEAYKMPWYVYYSIDVALFLVGILVLVLVTTGMFFRCVFTALCKTKSKQD